MADPPNPARGALAVLAEKEATGKLQPSSREPPGSRSAEKVRTEEEKKAPRRVIGQEGSAATARRPRARQPGGGVELCGSVRRLLPGRLLPGHLSELSLLLRDPSVPSASASSGALQIAGRALAAARSASPRPAPASRSGHQAARRPARRSAGWRSGGTASGEPPGMRTTRRSRCRKIKSKTKLKKKKERERSIK